MAEHHGGDGSRSQERKVLKCWFAELRLEGASGLGKIRGHEWRQGETCGCEAEEGRVGGSVPGGGTSELNVMGFWFKCTVLSMRRSQAPRLPYTPSLAQGLFSVFLFNLMQHCPWSPIASSVTHPHFRIPTVLPARVPHTPPPSSYTCCLPGRMCMGLGLTPHGVPAWLQGSASAGCVGKKC